jgi:hypothetical protein
MHHDLYRQVGDLDYLLEQKEYMVELIKRFLPLVDENGSEVLTGHRFLDWPNESYEEGKHAGLQGILKIVLEKSADMLRVFGENELADECIAKATLMTKHVPDPGTSKQGASMLALSRIVDPKEVNERWLAPGGAHGYSTFFGYYLLVAKAMAGDFAGALDDIKSFWGTMLDFGATTFWEDFDLAWIENAGRIDEMPTPGKDDLHADFGKYCYKGLRHSLCHGWASGPTAWLSQHVLGVEIVEPGYKVVKINPHLGDLEWVEGAVPTPFGDIKVSHRKDADGNVVSKVDAPSGVSVIM